MKSIIDKTQVLVQDTMSTFTEWGFTTFTDRINPYNHTIILHKVNQSEELDDDYGLVTKITLEVQPDCAQRPLLISTRHVNGLEENIDDGEDGLDVTVDGDVPGQLERLYELLMCVMYHSHRGPIKGVFGHDKPDAVTLNPYIKAMEPAINKYNLLPTMGMSWSKTVGEDCSVESRDIAGTDCWLTHCKLDDDVAVSFITLGKMETPVLVERIISELEELGTLSGMEIDRYTAKVKGK